MVSHLEKQVVQWYYLESWLQLNAFIKTEERRGMEQEGVHLHEGEEGWISIREPSQFICSPKRMHHPPVG